MTLKKIKTIDIFSIFALCFLTHFLYSWFPNHVFGIFFPVNESIWEHMKMLFTTILIILVFDIVFFRKWNIKFNNFFTNCFISALISIPIFLVLYWPIYEQIGENFMLNITVLFISIYFSQIVSYLILSQPRINIFEYISVIGIITCYIIFSILTYYPPETELFYDKTKNKYGLNHYNV